MRALWKLIRLRITERVRELACRFCPDETDPFPLERQHRHASERPPPPSSRYD